MLFKLSLRNVRRSYKNYTLYFFTLAFAVCIFYVFNSVDAQQSMLTLSESANRALQNLASLIGAISVFVSCILGFLIVFANNFLIRRRKKELGLYMTLGMEKSKIARILISETVIIGIFSLALGLLFGVFASQWLSLILVKLFDTDMTKYQFVFSSAAFFKTILYFGIIFLVAILFSTVAISKYKLIDLIYAERQNEQPKVRSNAFTLILFVLSIALLGTAYAMVIKNGIVEFDRKLLIEIIMGSVGTFLFFASLSGFFLRVMQANKRRYYKGLNMFVLRQVNSRVNSAFVSMSFICLMLFCTIGILSAGLGINTVLNSSIRNSIPFDVSISNYDPSVSTENILKLDGIDLNDYTARTYDYHEYLDAGITAGAVLDKVKDSMPNELKSTDTLFSAPMMMVTQSDYNKIMEALGGDPIVLDGSTVALFSDYAAQSKTLDDVLQLYLKENHTIELKGDTYNVYPKLLTQSLSTSMGSELLMLIVPDAMVTDAAVYSEIVNFNCSTELQNRLEQATNVLDDSDTMAINIRSVVTDSYAGSSAIISFIGIYLGIIFLLTSAAVLALQQLSEVADNRQRYDILRKIGVDETMINRAIFKQIAIYFAMPLLLACVHSVVGLYVTNTAIASIGDINVTKNLLMTAVFVLAVYGGYFLATYYGSKSMITKNK
ncbi:MAG: FtsX-like permease family protein [Anaerofustis sp.]